MRKTSCALGAYKILKSEGLIDRALVVAPLRVASITWPDEIEKWEDFCDFRWALLHGGDKDAWLRADADIFLINPEGLAWLLQDSSRIKKLNIDLLIVDESTKFKNSSTARFKLLRPHLGRFKRRWILTGTPLSNGYLDLFGQMYICDQGASLGPYVTHYRREYFDPKGFGGFDWRLKPGADKLIQRKIKPYVLHMDANDYLELPVLQNNNILVNLPSDARNAYKSMEDELFAMLDETKVTAIAASTASMKCEQLASGAVYKDLADRRSKNDYVVAHTEKLDALRDLVEQQQGTPLLILYWFNHEADMIEKALGKGGARLGGGVGIAQGRAIQRAWNNDELPWLLGHPASMAHGLNLQDGSADALCWYTMPWDQELIEQTWRRLVRSGSKHKRIMNHRLIARNTVDEVKLAVVDAKERTQRKFLEAFRAYRRAKK